MGDVERLDASTSHVTAVDRDGMIVALTSTLLSSFGSRYVSPSTGILMNNGIMWLYPRPGGPNAIGPGKRPLCNVCRLSDQLRLPEHDRAARRWAVGGNFGRDDSAVGSGGRVSE